MLYQGDNLTILKSIETASIDLIYIDPPFNKSDIYASNNGSFEDKFKSRNDYIQFMRLRLVECHRALKATGSIYLHCDPSISHYLKILLDEVFGEKNYKNDIVWRRCGHAPGTNGKMRKFGVMTDSILFYVKSSKATFHPVYTPYRPEHFKRYRYTDKQGQYEVLKAIVLNGRHGRFEEQFKFRGIIPPRDYIWMGSRQWMDIKFQEGNLELKNDMWYIKRRPLPQGLAVGSLWEDIKWKGTGKLSRTGYPTEKPLALLERIIKASSNEGDIVLDAFCGSGTTCVAAKNLGRQWIGIDSNPEAIAIAKSRLSPEGTML